MSDIIFHFSVALMALLLCFGLSLWGWNNVYDDRRRGWLLIGCSVLIGWLGLGLFLAGFP